MRNNKLNIAVMTDINVRREVKKVYRELWPLGTMPRASSDLIDSIHVGEKHERYNEIQSALDKIAKQFDIVE